MIPSYDLMYVINKECIAYLQSIWGNDECESCTYEEIYSNLMEELCDGALDIPLYTKESKEYYKTNRDVNFNKYMLDILLKMYELLGDRNLEMTYKVRLAKKNNTCNMFTDGYQEEWDRFIGG